MQADDQDLDDGPPLAPDGDERRVENAPFSAMCNESAQQIAGSTDNLGEPLLTHSVNWGYVWRVDYAIAGQPPDNEYVNRIVIWGKDASTTRATVAVGQRVPPLPPGNISGE